MAATLPIAAGAAYDSLLNLAVTPGQSLLILGIGSGVGRMAAQLAALGGVTVIGTASAAKRSFVESLGAIPVANDTGDLEHRLRELLPAGADAVLDLVGALDTVAAVLTDRTRVLTVADEQVAARYGARPVARRGDPTTLLMVAELVACGKVDPCVHRVFQFAEAGAALALVESGHAAGKVVLALGSPSGP